MSRDIRSTKLCLNTDNEYLKSKYSERQANFESDSGFDLYCPETVEVPANAISFMLDLEVRGCLKTTIRRFKGWHKHGDGFDTDRLNRSLYETKEEYQKVWKEFESTGSVTEYFDPQVLNTKPYMIFPRSSMGARTPLRLGNSIGLVDKDYRGNLKLCLDNLSDEPFTVEQGTRLVQLVRFGGEPFHGFELVDILDETSRGAGGFGSTGK